jgi:hypothetical protein
VSDGKDRVPHGSSEPPAEGPISTGTGPRRAMPPPKATEPEAAPPAGGARRYVVAHGRFATSINGSHEYLEIGDTVHLSEKDGARFVELGVLKFG